MSPMETTLDANEISLAINGGAPVCDGLKGRWPQFSDIEMGAVQAVMASGKVNYWTGQEGREFEKEFSRYVGTAHAVALANGTLALELALEALGIGPGDEVIVPTRTFIATASAVVAKGATPVIADVDLVTQNISVETIRDCVSEKTKAIICVHLGGWPCDMDAIMAFAKEYSLYVVEDCAQAHGAFYKGRSVGSLGDVAAFSFCQDKIMSTLGEGGMLTTNNQSLWKKAWAYKDHGKSYDRVYHATHPVGFRWLHEGFGSNYRLTEAQSAVGRIQLKNLNETVKARTENASFLTGRLATIPGLRTISIPGDIRHAFYKYYVFVDPKALRAGWDRDRINDAINQEGIPCINGSCSEIYKEKAFQQFPDQHELKLPNAIQLGQISLCFQIHPTLQPEDLENTAAAIEKVMRIASA
ncbi:MAG: dTDP-4-amino-4,6-dideoxygalactose transaminase [Candidatus Marinamargulisbacteria bacterium]|jgi:dTDP-4-amino-4,6-dideoxygalactose transaminase